MSRPRSAASSANATQAREKQRHDPRTRPRAPRIPLLDQDIHYGHENYWRVIKFQMARTVGFDASGASDLRSLHGGSMVACSRSECRHQHRQVATGHHLQRTPRSAATRNAFRRPFPARFVRGPHQISTVRTVLVMSGTFYFAVGEQWDESKLKPYPAGTLYSEPAKTPHYAWAKDGEVILQVTAIGPTGNTPIPQKQ